MIKLIYVPNVEPAIFATTMLMPAIATSVKNNNQQQIEKEKS
jgi:hypothetical protein